VLVRFCAFFCILIKFSICLENDILLLALGKLLENVPNQVLIGSVHELLPLLLDSLRSTSVGDEVATSSVVAIRSILSEAPSTLSVHGNTLVTLLLGLCDPEIRPMVRLYSLYLS
jgi:hypothetical protein